MNDYKRWQAKLKARKIVKILNKKGYTAQYAENGEEAKALVIKRVKKGSTIGFGGSTTLKEYGIVEHFYNGNYQIFDRYNQPNFDLEVECYRQALLADYFLTSTNVITENGELMNRDSSGNRASAIVFGPKEVIIVTGVNKVVKNMDEGFKRLRDIAPLNCKRIGHETPCAETGECSDCDILASMCNFTTIVHNGRKFGRYYIVVTPEDVGY